MKSFRQLLHERVSQNLYHATEFYRGVLIVEQDKFLLSEAYGDDINHNSGYKYFLSTARSMSSDFIKYTAGEGHSIAFMLDGDRLSQNFRIDAVDYMGRSFKLQDRSEKEDRVLSNKPSIQVSRYCKEIYCLLDEQYMIPESDEMKFKQYAPEIAPTWIFSNENDFLNLRKNKALKL